MKTTNPTRNPGLRGDILKVLTRNWQTTSLIASQLVIPPDALHRNVASQSQWSGKSLSNAGAKTKIVGQSLYALNVQGIAEKRYINGKKCEYRLAQPKSEQD